MFRLLLLLAVVAVVFILLRAAKRVGAVVVGGHSAEDARIAQELAQGLERMDKRIEAIEIIVDRDLKL